MSRNGVWVACACALAAGSFSSSARADVLIDNVGEPTRDTTIFSTVAPDDIWGAQAFLVSRRYTLDSVQMLLSGTQAGSDVVIELREGADPSGVAVATFTLPPLPPGGPEVVTLVPDAPFTLLPNTQYWIVIGVQSAGAIGWSYADGNANSGTEAIAAYSYSFDMGVTWGVQGTDNPYQFRIDGTRTCDPDFNQDGNVDQDDIECLAQVVAGDPSCSPLDADFNGDGNVDQDDIDALAQVVAGQPCP
ncbi:MAG: choice-of-anchor R domain-containing protein [Planctomycetota bacterium]|nr:choice-of-anchor R domain-containing protein [Planctomycetota bacterium]